MFCRNGVFSPSPTSRRIRKVRISNGSFDMKILDTTHQDPQARAYAEWPPLLQAEVTAGPDTSEQKTWRLLRPVTLIGSSRHAHVRIEADGIEALHAALLNTADAIVLASLVSRQGVYCGQQKVKTRVLQPGESFCLGACLLRLDLEPAAMVSPPQTAEVLRLPRPVHLKTLRGDPHEWTTDAIATVIGSRPGCDVRIDSKDVLPLQALLTRVGRHTVLASLAADKPIRVNDTPVNLAVLENGDTLTIWPIVLQLTIAP